MDFSTGVNSPSRLLADVKREQQAHAASPAVQRLRLWSEVVKGTSTKPVLPKQVVHDEAPGVIALRALDSTVSCKPVPRKVKKGRVGGPSLAPKAVPRFKGTSVVSSIAQENFKLPQVHANRLIYVNRASERCKDGIHYSRSGNPKIELIRRIDVVRSDWNRVHIDLVRIGRSKLSSKISTSLLMHVANKLASGQNPTLVETQRIRRDTGGFSPTLGWFQTFIKRFRSGFPVRLAGKHHSYSTKKKVRHGSKCMTPELHGFIDSVKNIANNVKTRVGDFFKGIVARIPTTREFIIDTIFGTLKKVANTVYETLLPYKNILIKLVSAGVIVITGIISLLVWKVSPRLAATILASVSAALGTYYAIELVEYIIQIFTFGHCKDIPVVKPNERLEATLYALRKKLPITWDHPGRNYLDYFIREHSSTMRHHVWFHETIASATAMLNAMYPNIITIPSNMWLDSNSYWYVTTSEEVDDLVQRQVIRNLFMDVTTLPPSYPDLSQTVATHNNFKVVTYFLPSIAPETQTAVPLESVTPTEVVAPPSPTLTVRDETPDTPTLVVREASSSSHEPANMVIIEDIEEPIIPPLAPNGYETTIGPQDTQFHGMSMLDMMYTAIEKVTGVDLDIKTKTNGKIAFHIQAMQNSNTMMLFLERGVKMVSAVADTIYEAVKGHRWRDRSAASIINPCNAAIKDWSQLMIKLTDTTWVGSTAVCDEVIAMEKRLREFQHMQGLLPREISVSIASALNALGPYIPRAKAIIKNPISRKMPVGICFLGPPGVGKTTTTTLLSNALGYKIYGSEWDTMGGTYMIPTISPYMDGYTGQKIVATDEMISTTEVGVNLTRIAEILMQISTARYQVHMAVAEDKGNMPWSPDFFFGAIMTPRMKMTADLSKTQVAIAKTSHIGLTDPTALWRRFAVFYIDDSAGEVRYIPMTIACDRGSVDAIARPAGRPLTLPQLANYCYTLHVRPDEMGNATNEAKKLAKAMDGDYLIDFESNSTVHKTVVKAQELDDESDPDVEVLEPALHGLGNVFTHHWYWGTNYDAIKRMLVESKYPTGAYHATVSDGHINISRLCYCDEIILTADDSILTAPGWMFPSKFKHYKTILSLVAGIVAGFTAWKLTTKTVMNPEQYEAFKESPMAADKPMRLTEKGYVLVTTLHAADEYDPTQVPEKVRRVKGIPVKFARTTDLLEKHLTSYHGIVPLSTWDSISENLYEIRNMANKRYGHMFFICGTVAATNTHVLGILRALGTFKLVKHEEHVFQYEPHRASQGYEDLSYYVFPNKDVNSKPFNQQKDIRHFIMDPNLVDTPKYPAMMVRSGSVVQLIKMKNLRLNHDIPIDGSIVTVGWEAVPDTLSIPGFCGGIWVSQDSSNPKIIGVHMAGNSIWSYAALLLLPRAEKHAGAIHLGPALSPYHIPEKSSIVPSPICDFHEPTSSWLHPRKRPAHLKPFTNQAGEVVDPLKKSLAALFDQPEKSNRLQDKALLDLYTSRIIADVGVHMNESEPWVTQHAAFNGLEKNGITYLSKMDHRKASGWPYSLPLVHKGKYKKKLSLMATVPGTQDWTFSDQLWHDFKVYFKWSPCRRLPPMIYFLKDELRTIAKVDSGATRAVYSESILQTLFLRRAFGKLICNLKQCLPFPCAVGINPEGTDWRMLFQEMRRADAVADGDDSAMDRSCGPEWQVGLLAIKEYLEKHGVHGGMEWTHKDESFTMSWEDIWNIILSTSHTDIQVGGQMYRIDSNPSGTFLTPIRNMFAIIFYVTAWYRSQEPQFKDSLQHFMDHVRYTMYGDDKILFVYRSNGKLYDITTLTGIAASFGFTVTNASKDGPMHYVPPEEITFLKRGFKLHKGTVLAPLDFPTIMEIPLWCKTGIPLQQQMRDLLSAFARLISHHPDRLYFINQYIDLVNKRTGFDIRIAELSLEDYAIKRSVWELFDELSAEAEVIHETDWAENPLNDPGEMQKLYATEFSDILEHALRTRMPEVTVEDLEAVRDNPLLYADQ